MEPKIHYAGAVTAGRTHVLPGWAACCSGHRAEKIRAERQNTRDPEKVTCAACLKMMVRGGIIHGIDSDGRAICEP